MGENWSELQAKYLHTLGNLTLTGYNSEYSDRPFNEKRDMEKVGFKASPLHLNEGLGDLDTWDESKIQARAKKLAKLAKKVWSTPMLDGDILDSYRPKKKVAANNYSIADFKHLADEAKLKPLFETLRKEILSLDNCVVEEFLKNYVAYKAETNFVDINPKATRLRMILNMKFSKVHDPRGVATDVTNKGRLGNGDIQVDIKSSDEIPYALGLVRQSLENQLDTSEE